MLHHKIHRFQEIAFQYIFYIIYFLYFLIAFGLSTSAPKYLSILNFYIKLYVSLFLMYRFNPFRKVKFTNLDRDVTFSAGVFVFATTAINGLLISYLEQIKNNVMRIF